MTNNLKFYKKIIFLFFIFNLISCEFFSKNNSQFIEKSNDSIIVQKVNDTILSVTDSTNATNKIEKINKTPIDSTKKYVYLTFDDGPYQGSKNINNILTELNAKATVFIVGKNAYTKKLKEYINDYETNPLIEISNHTFSHANNKYTLFYNNPNNVLNDVIKNDSMFKFNNNIIRLPGRNVWRAGKYVKNDFDKNSKITANLLTENNYEILGWDFEWYRASHKHSPLQDPKELYDNVIRRLNNNSTFIPNHLVLLMHDDMFNTDENANKLRDFIVRLKNNKDIVLEVASNYPLQ